MPLNREILTEESVKFISIVSSSIRYPEASIESIDSVGLVPVNRWDAFQYAFQNLRPIHFVSCIQNVEQFDSNLFGIYPKEANFIDPQSRMLLEETYEALVNKGYKSRGSNVGVTVGTYQVEY